MISRPTWSKLSTRYLKSLITAQIPLGEGVPPRGFRKKLPILLALDRQIQS